MGLKVGMNDVDFVMSSLMGESEPETLLGINLGWDFAAEHEFGLKDTRRDFGVSELKKSTAGIKSRTATVMPAKLFLKERKGRLWLFYVGNEYRPLNTDEGITAALDIMTGYTGLDSSYKKDKEIVSAWMDGSFVVGVDKKSPSVFILEQLYEAALAKKLVILTLGSTNPFSNSGLTLLDGRVIPDVGLKAILEADKDFLALKKASEKTGIRQLLKKKNKEGSGPSVIWAPFGYYALSPKWAKDLKSTKDGDIVTEYDVVYFLNPMQQNENNSGWFTVEDLLAWTEGKGPIPKKEVVDNT